jgi:hypothetical protein
MGLGPGKCVNIFDRPEFWKKSFLRLLEGHFCSKTLDIGGDG